MRVVLYFEYLDRLVRGARGQPPAVVIEDSIVLHVVSIPGEQVDGGIGARSGAGAAYGGAAREHTHGAVEAKCVFACGRAGVRVWDDGERVSTNVQSCHRGQRNSLLRSPGMGASDQ